MYLFKGCNGILIKPLTFYTICVVKTCTFPGEMENSLTPTFKSGSRPSQMINPIAVFSVLAKIFEVIIYKFLLQHILKYISNIHMVLYQSVL